MSLAHPDPEGHLTDVTISAIRDLRNKLRASSAKYSELAEALNLGRAYGFAMADRQVADVLDAILEPWGEGPTDD